MLGHKSDFHEENEDIEIVDLDSLEESNREVYGVYSEEQEHGARHVAPYGAHRSPLTPRFSTRQRVMQLSATSCLIGLVLFVLIFGNASTRTEVLHLIKPPTPAPTGTKYFYVAGSPLWGHLYIDGKLIAHPPDPTSRQHPPLSLPAGRHVLLWVAEPFYSQGCTMTEPPNPQYDTCKYDQYIASATGIGAWLFRFPANLLNLASSEQGTLVSTIQAALSDNAPSTEVLPGESYAVDDAGKQVQIAHVPLRATLHYYLDTNMNKTGICSTPLELNLPCVYAGQECHDFCSVQLYPDGPNAWDILVVVQATWDYTTLSGQTVALGQPEIKGSPDLFEHFMPFRITWDGAHWQASMSFSLLPPDMQQFFDPVCNAAMNHTRTDPTQRYIEASHLGTSWQYVSTENSASGCLGIVTLNKGPNAPPDASLPVAYCLHRFGVFVAANALAHVYWPVADAYEQHLSQQLAASYHRVEY